jgi:hypothetical protein
VALQPDDVRFAVRAEFFVLIVDTAAIVLAGLTVSFFCLLLIRRCGAEQGQKQTPTHAQQSVPFFLEL